MIVSHKHKFIFIKTQKTAGTSIEIALSGICGGDDIITPFGENSEKVRRDLGYPSSQNTEVSKSRYSLRDWIRYFRTWKPVRFYNHCTASNARRWLGRDIWDQYYKFSFERHPYDKVISHYYWRGGDDKFGSISHFIRTKKSRINLGMRRYGIKGKIAADKIYKYEELPEALADISNRLNLKKPIQMPAIKTKSAKRTDRRHYSEILNEKDKKILRKRYAFEFRYFGYEE